jgi:hypothetical protein
MDASFILSLARILVWPATLVVLALRFGKHFIALLPHKISSADFCSFIRTVILIIGVLIALSITGSLSFLSKQVEDPRRFVAFVTITIWPTIVFISILIFGGPVIGLLNRLKKLSVKDVDLEFIVDDPTLKITIDSAKTGVYPADDILSKLLAERIGRLT